MKVHQSLLSLFLIASLFACATAPTDDSHDEEYIHEIEQRRVDRLARLRGPRSWLSLVGRIPLQPGKNRVCIGDTCDVRLPGEQPMEVGTITIHGDSLSMFPAEGIEVLLDDGTVYPGGSIDYTNPPYMHMGSLYWTFLERSGEYFFRLWDTLSPHRNDVQEIPAYPVDPEWIIDVQFSPAIDGSTIVLDDVQGMRRTIAVEGTISGTWRDTAFSLLALEDGPDELFIIIEDATTDIETYPGGRYLDIPKPDSTGHTVIDFNKAYIPPCAFTEFATCLLPPDENRLPFAVRAGEKNHLH